MYSFLQRREEEENEPKLALFFFFGGTPRQFGITSHIKPEAQFTLFWFRTRCFLL